MSGRFYTQWVLALLLALSVSNCAPKPPPGDAAPPSPVHYYVRLAVPGNGRFNVSLAVDRIRADSLEFVFPVWIPGSYRTDNSPGLENFRARDGANQPLQARRLSDTEWRVYPDSADYVAISYQIPPGMNGEALAFAPVLERHSAYALGGRLFGTLRGFEQRPVTAAFDLPARWRTFAPLERSGANRFAANDYATLAAAPFIVGANLKDHKVVAEDQSHDVIVEGAPPGFSTDSLLGVVTEAIEYGTRFYGSPPYESYQFAFWFVPPDAAGIGATGQARGSAFFLPVLNGLRLREAGVGSLVLHQYLHAWYPGQFGPAALVRPDLSRPVEASDLWLIEGAAEYYARLLLTRYGSEGRDDFYGTMSNFLTWWRELGGDWTIDVGRLKPGAQSPTDRQDVARLVVGSTLAAFVLDLKIRDATRGVLGLDEVIRHARQATSREGYDSITIWTEVETSLELPVGTLNVLVAGGALSIQDGLSQAGLRATERVERRRSLGARLLVDQDSRFVLSNIERTGTAASSGLAEGDRLVKINETPVSPEEMVATRYAMTTYIREAEPGSPISFEVIRGGMRRQFQGTVRESQVPRVTIEEIGEAPATALLVRTSLFRPLSPTAPVPPTQPGR